MKALNTYNTESDAYIDKGMLEENGIKCVVSTDEGTSVFPVFHATIYVDDNDYDSAMNILKSR